MAKRPPESPLFADMDSTALLFDIMESIDEGCVLLDAELRIVYCSRALGANLDSIADLLLPGTPYADTLRGTIERGVVEVPPDATESYVASRIEALKTCQIKTIRLAGSRRTMKLTPHMVSGGGTLVIRTDVSELRKAQEDAQRESQRLVDALESIDGGAVLYDADETLVYRNTWMRDAFDNAPGAFQQGQSFEEVARQVFRAGYVPDVESEDAFVAERLHQFRALEGAVIRHGDDQAWHLHRQYRTSDGGILVIRTDITELRQAQEQAAQGSQRLVDALESIDGGAALYGADEVLVYCNTWMQNEFQDIAETFKPGSTFEGIARAAYRAGFVKGYPDEDAYLSERVRRFRALESAVIRQGDDASFHLHRQYRTSDGGTLIIRTDITDLRRAQHEAEQASRAKTEFLSSMSHEVRTPLNAVLGFAQMLTLPQTEPLTATQRSYVDLIIDSGGHLLALLDQVLELSRIESGAMEILSEAVDTLELVSFVVETEQLESTNVGVSLAIDLPATPPPPVRSDTTRVRQVLHNLISNAVKYNRSGGNVRVSVRVLEDRFTRIAVADDGPGIPDDAKAHLFEPFNRLGREAGLVKGSGVGLSICRRIAEALNARLDFESGPDGSVFWLDLPPDD